MTHDQLETYINRFQEHLREEVAKQVVDSSILQKAFDTPAGKQILSSAVDLIAADVRGIVKSCTDPSKDIGDVKRFADEINTTYKLILDWAKILIRGNEHKENAEKIK